MTEQLATVIYSGGTLVILRIFKPDESMDAIQKYKVTKIGQIPALFAMEWRLPNYNDYDISSLKLAMVGGQAVTRVFLEELSKMAPTIGTGYGLTEVAGFCTYTPLAEAGKPETIDEMLSSVGYDMPICPLTIRKKMNEDGSAGDELPKGEIGEICLSGPQVFLGYMNDDNDIYDFSVDAIMHGLTAFSIDAGTKDQVKLVVKKMKDALTSKGYEVIISNEVYA